MTDQIRTPSPTTQWQPIETAPRDGTIIELTWMDNGRPQEIWPMQWGHIQRNKLFAGDTVGMWVLPNGAATWTEHDPDGAPTHWRPLPANSEWAPSAALSAAKGEA